MNQYWKLAWRSLWRNKRRTLITLASIFLSVFLCTTMRSVQKGTIGYMTSTSVRFSTGYIQIHAKGYWDDKTINNSFGESDSLWSAINGDNNISLANPRLESFALVSSGQHTKGIAVLGIDAKKENAMTELGSKVVQGEYFHSGADTGVLIGEGMAEYLHVKLGDSIVLLGQGYHGATAAGQYKVQGIFHYPIEELNNSIAYLSLPVAQRLFASPHRLTSVSILLADEDKMSATSNHLRTALGDTWEVMEWPEMNKVMVQVQKSKDTQWLIIQTILYIVVAFGMFGTILMMTMERRKEFAVMMSIGMKKTRLIGLLLLETLLLGLLGAIVGLILALPIVAYIFWHPIHLGGSYAATMQQLGFEPLVLTTLNPFLFLDQGMIVFGIALISSLYPLWNVGRLKMTEAMKL
jgi:ABC-type lipoprotein release transport system permease subunit